MCVLYTLVVIFVNLKLKILAKSIKNKLQQQVSAVPENCSSIALANKKKSIKSIKDVAEKPTTAIAQKVAKTDISKEKKAAKGTSLELTFQLNFHTVFGQSLYITGNHQLLGNGSLEKAIPLKFKNTNSWAVTITGEEFKAINETITYNYLLKNADGSFVEDWGTDKFFNPSYFATKKVTFFDAWNHAGSFENAFYTVPFQQVLLKANYTAIVTSKPKKITHTFRVKAPLLAKGQTLCICGNTSALGSWKNEEAVVMGRAEGENSFQVSVDLNGAVFPVSYKYAVYDVAQKQLLYFEGGDNRLLFDEIENNKQTIVNDGFAVLQNNQWKGAGVAVPVFSLKSENSFGVGEFADINLLVDWAKNTCLKLIQILPINDTTATHTWTDCYPYAAISAFALHPIYLNIDAMVRKENEAIVAHFAEEKKRLNGLQDVDYEAVMTAKMAIIRQLYPLQKKVTFKSKGYKDFYELNSHWLVPYAAFCFFRDEYGTPDFTKWPQHSHYNALEIEELTSETSVHYDKIAISYFTQFHLHQQLKAATNYAHENGVIVKGDIAIGIYRDGVDAWQQPELFHMGLQAGAPPDDFAVKGQNWGFPTYNWQRMKEDGFAWWKQRFEQMSYYFDAFRIDHILGFFRIWSIPLDAVEGILGYFVPAFPVHASEFAERDIWFDNQRYTKPFINDTVLWEMFGYDNDHIKQNFLDYNGPDHYTLKAEFNTQLKVQEYFKTLEQSHFNQVIKQHLFNLISNVILFEVAGSNGTEFHFRFSMASTTSFKSFDHALQNKLNDLYVNYFFRRQDMFWKQEALQKLPALKRTTNMLICGEDLGLVPDCVADVMKQLGLLSLEIQRMPKDPKTEFFHPNDAPYLSVVTPSTHDMSTIRGWWEEDKSRIQKFFNQQLGQWGIAPTFCSGWINKAIINQHLYSPAMWSIFQLQDLLGIDESIRRQNPNEERINVPAISPFYWRYRMHLTLEELLHSDAFNQEISSSIKQSGRG